MNLTRRTTGSAMPVAFLCALFLAAPGLWADHRPGHSQGGGHNDGGGGGQGGFGEIGNGCVLFENATDPGTIHADVDNLEYCNGTDGQVSVPSLLRMDTKKFNGNDRTYLIDATCHDLPASTAQAAQRLCNGTVEARVFQTMNGYTENPLALAGELNLPEMPVGQVRRVELRIDLGRKNGNLLFVDEARGCTSGPGGPVWIRCEGDVGGPNGSGPGKGDGLCDLWTVSTSDLKAVTNSADTRACLVDDGGILVEDVQADFTIDVCVLGASCPP